MKVSLLNGELQVIAPQESMSKLISVFFMVMYTAQVIGVLFYGFINDIYGINTSFVISSALLCLGCLSVFMQYRARQTLHDETSKLHSKFVTLAPSCFSSRQQYTKGENK